MLTGGLTPRDVFLFVGGSSSLVFMFCFLEDESRNQSEGLLLCPLDYLRIVLLNSVFPPGGATEIMTLI